ncbi:MAG TPA: hypothetical protein PKD72_05605 [Gemmatales bacterium]|nr:hypothetical protein [Gemmatales bacterium]
MQWVPFTVTVSAAQECRGMLYDEQDHLRFEYQLIELKNTSRKSFVKQLRINLKQVSSVNLVKGWQGKTWAGVRVVLEATKADLFKELPGVKDNRIELRVSKANVPLAEAFVDGLYADSERSAV